MTHSENCCIAIDAMGGDFAPKAIIDGAFHFHQQFPKVSFVMFGDEVMIKPCLQQYPTLSQASRFVHTTEIISNSAKPAQILRGLPRASMRLALECVAKQEAQGAVSAGNTGAYLALAKHILKTVCGIDRPAIASQIPTKTGESVMLDLGGMLEASSQNLVEYAIMGSVFAKQVLGIENPSIGLLNVGREETKGSDVLQQAFLTLKKMPLNFLGFIEGDDIYSGTASVIITDGFTGNISLKTAEGIVRLLFSGLKDSFSSSLKGRMVGYLAKPFLKKLFSQMDPRIYNGALWLGLNGVAVKSHGGTDAFGFSCALKMAYHMIQADMVGCISNSLGQIGAAESL